jgi:cell division protein FtsZ
MDFDVAYLARSQVANKLELEHIYSNWPLDEFGELARVAKHKSAIAHREQRREAIGKADVVFIVAGMGGSTGSSTAPVIAELTKETGTLTIGVGSTPMTFERQSRHKVAWKGIDDLNHYADTLIIIPDAAIEKMFDKKAGVDKAFQAADDYLYSAVQCLVDFISGPYLHPLDDDFVTPLLRSVTGKATTGNLGMGYASGENRAIKPRKWHCQIRSWRDRLNRPRLYYSIVG